MDEKPARIDFSITFDKQLRRSPSKIRQAFRNRFALFLKNPHHPLLRNHQLTGKFGDLRSINVTGDWRALYILQDEEGKVVIVFSMLGTHSQLYK